MNRTLTNDLARRAWVIGALWLLRGPGDGAVAANLPTPAPTESSQTADARFWSALHGADYAAYPQALAAVEAALAESPEDPLQNAHLGWLHIWHLSEAEGFGASPQEMSADLADAKRYFRRAVELDPAEARYLGFYGSTLVVDAAVRGDADESRRADATLERAVRMWPEFNLFTAGYLHSGDPYDSPQYATALQRMWRNVDVCIGRTVSRKHPDIAPYLSRETTVGRKRACWNSAIAPHNLEGFFLNFGDMLVKQGDVTVARAMYANARLSTTYSEWAYRDLLEQRIVDAAVNVAAFRDSARSQDGGVRLMGQSDISCMACHRR
jgi:tetratricopeptide (TPR) repeat protein